MGGGTGQRMQNEQEKEKTGTEFLSACIWFKEYWKIKIWLPLGMGKQARGRLQLVPLPTIRPRFTEYLLWALIPRLASHVIITIRYQLSYTTVVMARTNSNMCARLWLSTDPVTHI